MLEAGPAARAHARFHRARLALPAEVSRLRQPEALLEDQPVQRLCYACDEYSHQFFVNDQRAPLHLPRRTSPSCGFAAGRWAARPSAGRARATATATYEFKAASRDGYGAGLALQLQRTRALLRPGRALHRRQRIREGLEQLPDGRFLPPMNLSCGELRSQRNHREEIRLARDAGPRRQPDRPASTAVPPATTATSASAAASRLPISTVLRSRCLPPRAPAASTW